MQELAEMKVYKDGLKILHVQISGLAFTMVEKVVKALFTVLKGFFAYSGYELRISFYDEKRNVSEKQNSDKNKSSEL